MNNLSPETTFALLQASQADTQAQNKKIKSALESKELEQIDAVAKDFEAVFMSEMLKPMFADIKTDGLFGGGKGEEVFRGMMLQEYGKLISQTGSVGLADHVKEAMIQMQEAADQQIRQQNATPNIIDLEPITTGDIDETSHDE